MEIFPLIRKKMIKIAKPIEDSHAAMVKIKIENNCPKKSSKYTEKTMKFKLTLNKINSIQIKIIKMLRL